MAAMAEEKQEVPPAVPREQVERVLSSRAKSASLPRRDALTIWDEVVTEHGNPTALERRRG